MEVILYRLEHKDSGLGPFLGKDRSLVNKINMGNVFNYGNLLRYPRPEDDKFIDRWITREERVACKSIEQLKYWFEDWFEKLKPDGFIVVKLTIDDRDTTYGKHQVLYIYEEVLHKEVVNF